jgi:secretion/DNA translocation related TadE-like protein
VTALAPPGRHDGGSGSALVLAVVVVAVLLCGLLVPLYMGIAAKRMAASGADAAALAAADALWGSVPGFPCEVADQVARSAGTVLEHCGTEEGTAVVTVSLPILGMAVAASARAGPPLVPEGHGAQSPERD